MVRLIATDDFISFLEKVPIKYLPLLNNCFISMEKIQDEEISKRDNCISDLLEQLRNQELE